MLKTLGWLAVGVVTGAVAVLWLGPSSELSSATPAAVPSDTGTPFVVEDGALADRVVTLEAQVTRLTSMVANLDKRLAEATQRANSEAAARAAAVREIEQRLTATSPGDALSAVLAAPTLTPESTAAASAAGEPLLAPTNLQGVEAQPGQTLVFRVTGTIAGSVWGTDSYTDDSAIAAAAVHAGVLRPGETGTIMVIVQNGYPNYRGSSRYGVDSQNFGDWDRSFAIQRLY